ncbi:dTMP kinase [Acinetobacter sp. DSM 11652]|uniref:dTMP kinase n=1 Tax=Acinetobacter sp. DSM 11652 TaxID=346222 RepID=UPI0008CAADA1|nr:dTMP kinase [Acinetobacter sp. DSM 11652]SEM18586.1 dTMP kinase [Acinetobacter sp. DSM 11652]
MKKGILITIEGIDGSGKGTQTQLLLEALNNHSIPTKIYSFPCYEETFFGKEVGAFLRGEFGSLEQVNPKLASILFAGDRFEKKNLINKDLDSGYIVICDRYVDSNIAHQCAKLKHDERQDLANWLEKLEYDVFGVPRPDLTFFLDVPLNISKNLVLKKKARSYTTDKEDIHESSYQYLENVYDVYQDLCEKRSWKRINCVQNENIRSINEIHNELINKIKFKA